MRIVLPVLASVLTLLLLNSAEARGRDVPPVLEVIEIEQPHAWCYVLKNRQYKMVGNINIISCVPKGVLACKPDPLFLEETESD